MTAFWIIVAGAAGLLIGGALAWLTCERRHGGAGVELQLARREAERLAGELGRVRGEAEDRRAALDEAGRRAAVLEERGAANERNLAEQRRLLAEAETRLRETFGGLADRSLAENNTRFLELAKERFAALADGAKGDLDRRKIEIEGLLRPMREVLRQYQDRLAEVEQGRQDDKQKLAHTLGELGSAHQRLATQTTQLVTALSRPNARGRWGEVQLDRILELSGLHEGTGYTKQATAAGEDDDGAARTQRPDVVVNMPGGRSCVIDCKLPGDAFMDAVAESDEQQRARLMAVHAKSVREHVRQLSRKAYWKQFEPTPEYVVMFIPAEAFLYAAVDVDGGLIEDALESKVILATPTTLIALLKAIEYGWRQERQAENVEKVRKLGVLLHERLCVFAGHFQNVGRQLEQGVKVYNEAVGSMDSRLAVTARELAELGAHGDKELAEPETVTAGPRATKLLASGDGNR